MFPLDFIQVAIFVHNSLFDFLTLDLSGSSLTFDARVLFGIIGLQGFLLLLWKGKVIPNPSVHMHLLSAHKLYQHLSKELIPKKKTWPLQ